MNLDSFAVRIERPISQSLSSYGQRLDPASGPRALDRWVEFTILGVFVVGFWLVARRVPASGDDWAWGSQLGIERLTSGFAAYNGRYLGNVIVIVMTRLGWVAPVLEAVGFAAIISLVLDVTRNRTVLGYSTLIALIFLMPAPIWGQSAVWVSGFANYAVATLVMLVCLRFTLKELATPRNDRRNPAVLGGIFVFAAASQLIVEHVTIYLLVSSLVALVVDRSIHHRLNIRLVAGATGFFVGALIMFSNSSYRLAATGDSYKKVGQEGASFLSASATALRSQIATNGLVLNTAVIFTITALIVATGMTQLSRAYHSPNFRPLRFVPVLAAIAGLLVSASRLFSDPVASGSNKTVVAMVLVLALVVWSASLLSESGDKMMVVVSVVSLVILFAPLLLVTPIGARNFLPTYAFLLVIVSTLLSNVAGVCDTRLLTVWKVFAASAAMFGWVSLVGIYNEIGDAADDRIASVRSQVEDGKKNVEMERLPNRMWMQYPDPLAEPWVSRFKNYYDIPPDVSVSLTG